MFYVITEVRNFQQSGRVLAHPLDVT